MIAWGYFRLFQVAAQNDLRRLYHERVVDHFDNPRNFGSFNKNDSDIGTGLVGAPACGDVMKLQIKVDEKTGKITDACFKTFGYGSAIASSSVGEANGGSPYHQEYGNGHLPSGSARARRDAAARAMQGWHSQRLYGIGEDKRPNSMQKRENKIKSIGSLKQKRPNEGEPQP